METIFFLLHRHDTLWSNDCCNNGETKCLSTPASQCKWPITRKNLPLDFIVTSQKCSLPVYDISTTHSRTHPTPTSIAFLPPGVVRGQNSFRRKSRDCQGPLSCKLALNNAVNPLPPNRFGSKLVLASWAKPILETKLINHEIGHVAFRWVQFHIYIFDYNLKMANSRLKPLLSGSNEFNVTQHYSRKTVESVKDVHLSI